MYKCVSCNREVETQITRRIRCPYCGYRILSKRRTTAPKTIEAR